MCQSFGAMVKTTPTSCELPSSSLSLDGKTRLIERISTHRVKDAKLSVQALTSPRTSGREGGGLGLSRVTFETYEHVAHTWSKVEVDDVARWMHRTLGGPFATTGVVDESRKTLAPLSRMR